MKLRCPNCAYVSLAPTFRFNRNQSCPCCKRLLIEPAKQGLFRGLRIGFFVLLLVSLVLAISGLIEVGLPLGWASLLCAVIYLILFALLYPLLVKVVMESKR